MAQGIKIPVITETKGFIDGIKDAAKDATKIIEDMNKKIKGSDSEDKKDTKKEYTNKFVNSVKSGVSKLYGVADTLTTTLFGVEVLSGIGIWSGFLTLLTGAMGIVKKESQEIVNKLAYIKAMLQSAYRALYDIAHKFMNWVLDGIIKIAYWIDYVVQAWFGISLLAKTGEEYEKSMKESAKSAKEIRKQLMGFDEANILNDNSSGSTGLTPTAFNINAEQIPVPDWVKWVADNKDLIIGLAEAVGIAFVGIKSAGVLAEIASIFGSAGAAGAVGGTGLLGLATSLLAITAIAAGIAVIVTIAKYIWDDLQKLKQEIDEVTKKNQELNNQWLENTDPVSDYNSIVDSIGVNLETGRRNLADSRELIHYILGTSEDLELSARRVAENTDDISRKAKQIMESDEIDNEQKLNLLELLKQQKQYNDEIITELDNQGKNTQDLKKYNEELNKEIETYNVQLGLSTTNVENNSEEVDKNKKKWQEIVEKLKEINNQDIDDKDFEVTPKLNKDGMERGLDTLISKGLSLFGILNPDSSASSVVNKISSFASGVGSKLKNLFHFDGGGIVLPQPGHGVPIGASAIMSERRAEGIIPLENPTAMEKLGEAIGRWVNISLQNNMVVDGRVLASATNNQLNKERFLMNR